MKQYTPIAETNNFIVLDKYTKLSELNDNPPVYQTERALELEFIQDLVNQGYERRKDLKTYKDMLDNIRVQIQTLNDMVFTDNEWVRFVEDYLDKPSDNLVEKSRKIHENSVYDFKFDDGTSMQNIHLLDKENVSRNKVQVISQFEQKGTHANRYDVTILVNGLPLVQVELKKRGVAIREAFNQVHRYSKESFNSDNSLFKIYTDVCDLKRYR
jgi:type I restriction enzyme R subunit